MKRTNNKITLITFSFILLGLIVFFFCFKDEKTHTLKRYYPDSKETYVHEYIIRNGDTIFQGKVNVFNEKGIKVAEGNLINNLPRGKFIYYYDSGKIESIKYVIDNKRNAEYLWNYPNGEIEKYAFFSKYKEPIFLISYDEKGPTKYEGSTIESIYHRKLNSKEQQNIEDNQDFKVGDTLIHQYILANIPKAKRSFKIESIGIDNIKVKRKITALPPTTIQVKEVLTTKGKNTIRAVVKYEFKDNIIPAINDTLSFDLEVH
ncbi:hypothetical protein [Flavobacterium sp.]|jgi:hypothetical protein|uniref:hypothetical protein n=1 Tax=Flavobacterium sp. TaxID=239 RepID=UPI00391905E8